MGYTVERHGFSKFSSADDGALAEYGLAQRLMVDLSQVNGMTKIHPTQTIGNTTEVAVFESNAQMDPLADRGEKWRVRIETGRNGTDINSQYIRINMGTEHQIPDNGDDVTKTSSFTTSGNLAGPTDTVFTGRSNINNEPPFLSGARFFGDLAQDPGSSPMSYRLSVSDHGIAFCTWRNAYDDSGDMFAWFVAQRPVDPADGSVLDDYYSPVFCVFSVGGGGGEQFTLSPEDYVDFQEYLEDLESSSGNTISRSTVVSRLSGWMDRGLASTEVDGIRKFVVRETDVHAPTPLTSAVVAQEDSNPIINPMEQVSISVDNKYMITFPSGLNTQRRAYKHELDMLAYTSSDVIAQDSDVSVTVFGEATPRTYKAMQANKPYNTGMRVLILTEGAGISGDAEPPVDP